MPVTSSNLANIKNVESGTSHILNSIFLLVEEIVHSATVCILVKIAKKQQEKLYSLFF